MPTSSPRPLHKLQQDFINLRFGMFLHYNMATYQDREWGDPRGDAALFDPAHLDTDQWAEGARSAGMTYGCLTAKHHDGFCLWPTETSADGIFQTNRKNDVVRAYADSFRSAGLKVGLYFSILDLRSDIRHHNVTRGKIDLIKAQLGELLTNYGEIAVLVLDGWHAPWSRITYREIPFAEIYTHIKSLQPNCLVCELNASEYPPSGLFYSDIKSFEQNAGQLVPEDNRLPALSCVTLTKGWFWKKADEHAELKPVAQVVDEWLRPLNDRFCNVICNAAPNCDGRLSPNLMRRLREIGEAWRHEGPVASVPSSRRVTTPNLAEGQAIHASFSPDTVGPDMANDGDFATSWFLPQEESEGWIQVTFSEPRTINLVVITEPVGLQEGYDSTRFGPWSLEVQSGQGWQLAKANTGLDAVQFVEIEGAVAHAIRLSFRAAQPEPGIAEIGAYFEPPLVDS